MAVNHICVKCRQPIDEPDSNGIVVGVMDEHGGPYHVECWQGRPRTSWWPIESAPHACHFIAAYFYDCEWCMQIVMRPFSGPFTHWMPLPEPPK